MPRSITRTARPDEAARTTRHVTDPEIEALARRWEERGDAIGARICRKALAGDALARQRAAEMVRRFVRVVRDEALLVVARIELKAVTRRRRSAP